MSSPAPEPVPEAAVADARPSGIPAVGDLRWGAHFCHFYDDEADLLEIVIPYFRAGLESNEFCLWVASEGLDLDRAIAELRRGIADFDEHLSAGRVEILRAEQWYLAGDKFDPDRIVRGWDDKLLDALARGFDGIRVHGNEAWLSQGNWAAFAEYEARLDAVIAGKRMLVLCTYPLASSSGAEIFDIARTHQFSIARRRGASEVMEHADAVGATAEIQRLNWQLERLVSERTAELAAANIALAEREALYRFLAENMSDVISLYDMEGARVYVSPSVVRVLGWTPKDIFDGVHPADLSLREQAWGKARQGEPQTSITRRKHVDGSWRWLEASERQVTLGGDPHVLIVTRDVTERVRLEEQLHHAQKMEALGRLAGGVAHDFNNLLTAIFGYAELALGDLPAGSPATDSLSEIKAAAERARRVTRQLLTFSRREVRQPQIVDLARVVRGLEPMLRLLLREDVGLHLQACEDRLPVFSDPVQLEQALVNLVSNARDATDAGESIRIGCDVDEIEAGRRDVPSYVRPGRYARLRVRDNGTGMPAEVAAQAFEPFFTTKPVGLGTGLGLSTVFGIAKQGGGYVWIESEEGEGTSVFVLLPLAPAQPEEREEPAAARSSRSLSGMRIAVVEDEEVVRHFVTAVLGRSGAEVLTFGDSHEALRALLDEDQVIDVLVTDVVMPGMTGPSLVAAAHSVRPDLKIVFMSGYAAEEDGLAAIVPSSAILEKPFSPADLLEKIATATGIDPLDAGEDLTGKGGRPRRGRHR